MRAIWILIVIGSAVLTPLWAQAARQDQRVFSRSGAVSRNPRPPVRSQAPRPPDRVRRGSSSRAVIDRSHSDASSIVWTAESRELHRTEARAYQDALEVAREKLIDDLRRLYDIDDFSISLEDVRKFVRNKTKEEVPLEDPVNEVMCKVRLELALGPTQQYLLMHQIRMTRAWKRQVLVGKSLLIVLALLLTTALYYHIDDRTKGHLTPWLRVGAVAALAATGVGAALLLFG